MTRTGLYGVSLLGIVNIDRAFVTTLVELWCLENRTFHLLVREALVTLQDVVVLTDPGIDGPPITAPTANE